MFTKTMKRKEVGQSSYRTCMHLKNLNFLLVSAGRERIFCAGHKRCDPVDSIITTQQTSTVVQTE